MSVCSVAMCSVGMLALVIVGCAGPADAPPPSTATPEVSAASTPAATELSTIEIWASYVVDEGWAVRFELSIDGSFSKEDSLGGPGGDDRVVRCTGVVPPEHVARIFDATRDARFVDEGQGYHQNVRATGGALGHVGNYALVAVRADGARLEAPSEDAARALVPSMQSVLAEADRVIEAGGRRTCREDAVAP